MKRLQAGDRARQVSAVFEMGYSMRLPGMKGEPLNYLPSGAYVEVDGKPVDTVSRSLSYSVR